MHTADYVDKKVEAWIDGQKAKADIVWDAAKLCVGWPYVYSAWGDYCTPSERRKRYRMTGKETIKTKCKGFDSGKCDGCQWYPDGKRVRCFDCRGFTDWCLKQVGIDLYGDTVSTQWNHKENWAANGEIATMPKDKLCCLFVYKDGKWNHTGFGYGDEACECSSNVEYYKVRKAKWTHWAVPAGLYDGEIKPEPAKYPTLRKGNTGAYVRIMQEALKDRGYDLGICGVDGDFGTATEKAVKEFQRDAGLTQDGICGAKTWTALQAAVDRLNAKPEPVKSYTVTISGLMKGAAEELVREYPNAVMTETSGK